MATFFTSPGQSPTERTLIVDGFEPLPSIPTLPDDARPELRVIAHMVEQVLSAVDGLEEFVQDERDPLSFGSRYLALSTATIRTLAYNLLDECNRADLAERRDRSA